MVYVMFEEVNHDVNFVIVYVDQQLTIVPHDLL
jgi:hypothetical protein